MVPLYAARIEDLGPNDFVKIDCAACSHRALLTPAVLRFASLITAVLLALLYVFLHQGIGNGPTLPLREE
jgi:hypothetical protein